MPNNTLGSRVNLPTKYKNCNIIQLISRVTFFLMGFQSATYPKIHSFELVVSCCFFLMNVVYEKESFEPVTNPLH